MKTAVEHPLGCCSAQAAKETTTYARQHTHSPSAVDTMGTIVIHSTPACKTAGNHSPTLLKMSETPVPYRCGPAPCGCVRECQIAVLSCSPSSPKTRRNCKIVHVLHVLRDGYEVFSFRNSKMTTTRRQRCMYSQLPFVVVYLVYGACVVSSSSLSLSLAFALPKFCSECSRLSLSSYRAC